MILIRFVHSYEHINVIYVINDLIYKCYYLSTLSKEVAVDDKNSIEDVRVCNAFIDNLSLDWK